MVMRASYKRHLLREDAAVARQGDQIRVSPQVKEGVRGRLLSSEDPGLVPVQAFYHGGPGDSGFP